MKLRSKRYIMFILIYLVFLEKGAVVKTSTLKTETSVHEMSLNNNTEKGEVETPPC